jgi:hypothetical protein
VASILLGLGACGQLGGTEIVGKVVRVAGNTIDIAITAEHLPKTGDLVEVYFELEGIEEVATVATGHVTAGSRGRVTAELSDVQGKVQVGMAVRFLARVPGAPKPNTPAPAIILGTVSAITKRTAQVSTASGRTPRVGDAVAFCFEVPGTGEVLQSATGKVTAVDQAKSVVQILDGFALPGQSVRISAGAPKPARPDEHSEPPQNDPSKKARVNADEESAAQAIQDLGGKVTRLADGRVFVVDLSNTQVRDGDLVHLRPLKTITFLMLDNTPLTDSGLQHLRELRQLESLSLGGTKLSDAGLEHLSGLAQLAVLILRDTAITDDGLRHLGELKKLELLDVGGTRVTEEGAKTLKSRLPALESLIGAGIPNGAASGKKSEIRSTKPETSIELKDRMSKTVKRNGPGISMDLNVGCVGHCRVGHLHLFRISSFGFASQGVAQWRTAI